MTIAATAVVSVLVTSGVAAAAALPSGEVVVGRTVVEPAYDLSAGVLVYLSTPMGAQVHPNFAKNVAPIYLPMYPVGSPVGVLNCQDTTATTENCPDHGPEVAAAMISIANAGGFGSCPRTPCSYTDHLVGIASTGGDFNVLWELRRQPPRDLAEFVKITSTGWTS